MRGRAGMFLLAAFLAGAIQADPLPVGKRLRIDPARRLSLEKEARAIVDLLQNFHYSGLQFREIKNSDIIGCYLDELDPDKEILTSDDVRFIHERFDHSLKSVYLMRGDLEPAFEMFDLFMDRARARFTWIDRRLAGDFDLSVDDTFNKAPKSEPPVEMATLDGRWERALKAAVLTEMLSGRTKDGARAEVARHFSEFRRVVAATSAIRVREHFLDAVIRSYDPHSGYFSPDSARDFSVTMGGAVDGVGLDLATEGGACVVAAVQPDGPADLHSDIHPGDTIVKFSDPDGRWTSTLAEVPLQDILALARGSPGTRLRVTFTPAGTSQSRDVVLERAHVLLPADKARGAVCFVPNSAGHPSGLDGSRFRLFMRARVRPAGSARRAMCGS